MIESFSEHRWSRTIAAWLHPRRTAKELWAAESNMVLLIRTIARLKEAEVEAGGSASTSGPPRHLHVVK
jgi:hypothetical protein